MDYQSKATGERMSVKLIRAPITVTPVTSAACKIGGRTAIKVHADTSLSTPSHTGASAA